MFHGEHLRIHGVASSTCAFLPEDRLERKGGRRCLLQSLCNHLLVANNLQSPSQSCTKNLDNPLQPFTTPQRTYLMLHVVGDREK